MKPETKQALADALGGKLQPDGKFIHIIKHTGKTGEYDVNSIPMNVAGMAQLAIEYEVDVEWIDNGGDGVDKVYAMKNNCNGLPFIGGCDFTQESKEAAYCEAVAQCLIQMLGE